MRIHTWVSRSVDWAHNKPAKYLGARTLEQFTQDNRHDPSLIHSVKGLEDHERHLVVAYGGTSVKTFSKTLR